MVFGARKPGGVTLRARVRRTTPLLDIAIAVIIGGASGVYIFNDSMRKWHQSELEFASSNSTTNSSTTSTNPTTTPSSEDKTQ